MNGEGALGGWNLNFLAIAGKAATKALGSKWKRHKIDNKSNGEGELESRVKSKSARAKPNYGEYSSRGLEMRDHNADSRQHSEIKLRLECVSAFKG